MNNLRSENFDKLIHSPEFNFEWALRIAAQTHYDAGQIELAEQFAQAANAEEQRAKSSPVTASEQADEIRKHVGCKAGVMAEGAHLDMPADDTKTSRKVKVQGNE